MEISKSEKTYDPCESKDKTCSLEKISITIDNKNYEANKSQTIVEVAKQNGITIPTLCYHPDLKLGGICRICVVSVDGKLETACSYKIEKPINIITHNEEIRQVRRNLLELILSNHVGECYSCVRNNHCELQTLAAEYGITELSFKRKNLTPKIESNHPIIRDMDKCILCRRCIRTCLDLQNVGVYSVHGRSIESSIDTYKCSPMEDTNCINCGQCINRCPTGALSERDDTENIWSALNDPNKYVIIQTAPAPRAGIGELFGLEAGTPLTGELTAALKKIGFNKVFDTCLTADLTIIEEGTELLKRIVNNDTLPMFTSCSPGWVKYIEHFYPELLSHLSSAKSPQQMFGAILKTYYAKKEGINPKDIVSVALMPCTAKKYEANRPEMNSSGYRDVDYGITTREIGKMIKEARIELPNIQKSEFDEFFTGESGSGVIFGYSGGVLESALRTIHDLITGNNNIKSADLFKIYSIPEYSEVKCIEITINNTTSVPELLKKHFVSFDGLKGATIKTAIVHGTANAKKILDNIKDNGVFNSFHFIEFMACPGGCLGGGGQPIPTSKEIREKRKNAIISIDEGSIIRKSYENPSVIRLYNEFLEGYPNSNTAHKYLHTKYTKRYNNEEQ